MSIYMVKNQTGGNKGKKQAAKDHPTQKKIRLQNEEGEVYAVVTKMLGNCQCQVVDLNGKSLLCMIRKKFTGKHKHQHLIRAGSWVLVGLRDWETVLPDKWSKCDLLEVYSDTDKHTLSQQSNLNVEVLTTTEKQLEFNEETEECEIDFSEI